ncbi:MAG TPA: radical SAM protein [Kofleriaceae bacterium]|nr:radical SAM protein [Kofleriaceae bacterium]
MPPAPVALVFPPHWYYASVPADLLYTGSFLRRRNVPVRCFDLSSGAMAHALAASPGYRALRDPATYESSAAYEAASREVWHALGRISQRHAVRYDFFGLRFPGLDEGHLPAALAAGLDPARNPVLAYLRDQVPVILADDPALIAIALVHPEQRVQVPVLGRLLREAGYRGALVIYGSHEDVLAPEDLVADLIGEPRHRLFDDFDGVIVGEAETPLWLLWQAVRGWRPHGQVPGLIAPRWGLARAPAPRPGEDLRALPALDHTLVDPAIYPFPTPMIDVRHSRGCPWNRCTFCAITAHQAGYRARPIAGVLDDLADADRVLGARFVRFRDDLLTPRQLRELAAQLAGLPFAVRWSARARFEANLTRETLAAARDAGLEELWLGLEAASERVRRQMDKGVAQPVVERILVDASELGIRVRVLCMVGYPGETADEVRETFAFLKRHLFRITSASLSAFQLMRAAPLGRDPARHGVHLVADPTPRDERVRHDLRAEADGLDGDTIARLIEEGKGALNGWLRGGWEGPSLAHAWLHASVLRGGWPSGARDVAGARPQIERGDGAERDLAQGPGDVVDR